ncbi:Imm52 family immunity protein [Archangium violaceum]|uniref:Imm52 family immunity protein n=1 Tax=Archangium violaceum TaxID=83451 RepID=UPI0037C179E7
MTERYYTGVYWPARLESAEECARRSATFFRLLSQCDELYARWYEKGDTEEEAIRSAHSHRCSPPSPRMHTWLSRLCTSMPMFSIAHSPTSAVTSAPPQVRDRWDSTRVAGQPRHHRYALEIADRV